ncbi:MAG: hypothetical protein A3K19_17470 [Lentisphaerae bacterium RIFOXYB12_FULL_65_16]|nr:MAG: hypothetical protein A3K18_12485 [Lentisphaerae bacterium RIFOXYA12_64_32]OGV85590.1 MAG: hypothetical protein A3K19_17470 [Lentisphaerae bacterium RIFOXYB12_FULL_65_16]
MEKLVTNLIELQELEIVLEESRIVHRGKHPVAFGRLEGRVVKLRRGIPGQSLKRYDALRRSGLGAVRETNGLCRGCSLNVPLGDLRRMRRGEMEWLCPNCGRYLLISSKADSGVVGHLTA